jgi:hypothetical protein
VQISNNTNKVSVLFILMDLKLRKVKITNPSVVAKSDFKIAPERNNYDRYEC